MTRLIGVDWGSSNLRAYRYDDDGVVLEQRNSSRGIVTIADGSFEAVLADLIGDWAGDGAVVVMAGMVGSRNGWHEAPYIPCPADCTAIAQAMVAVDTRFGHAFIVPGVVAGGHGTPADIMRGEETQLFGCGVADGQVILPGTHSKWAEMVAGRVVALQTAMTGELYALLLDHSLLGRLARAAPGINEAVFARGVERSLNNPAISMTLFTARADVLTGGLAAEDVAAYLSGLLIGAEVAAMATRGSTSLTIVGGPILTARYRIALDRAGTGEITVIDGDMAVATGLWQIGKGLL